MNNNVLTILRKNYPVHVLKIQVKNLDKSKFSNKFDSNNINEESFVYIKCDIHGNIVYRKKAKGEEYCTFEIDAHKIYNGKIRFGKEGQIKLVSANDVFNGVSKYLYSIGNTERITTHEIVSKSKFENMYIFKLKDRGIVTFMSGQFSSKRDNEVFFSDPRYNNNYHSEETKKKIATIDNKIEFLKHEREDLEYVLQRCLRVDEKDNETISNFLKHIEEV